MHKKYAQNQWKPPNPLPTFFYVHASGSEHVIYHSSSQIGLDTENAKVNTQMGRRLRWMRLRCSRARLAMRVMSHDPVSSEAVVLTKDEKNRQTTKYGNETQNYIREPPVDSAEENIEGLVDLSIPVFSIITVVQL